MKYLMLNKKRKKKLKKKNYKVMKHIAALEGVVADDEQDSSVLYDISTIHFIPQHSIFVELVYTSHLVGSIF